MQIEFTNPKFMRKSASIAKFPAHDMPEIAIIGKSNVGKSSFINHFLKKPNLTVTSSTPGRTQEFFFFNVHDKVVFVDLPGYGFAEVSKSMKQNWGQTLRQYISNREQLKLVLFLQDIRRMPTDEDLEIFDLIIENDLAMILLFTKVDKVSSNERAKNRSKIIEAFGMDNCMSVYYSALENMGRPELCKHINNAFYDILNKTNNQETDESSSDADSVESDN